MNNSYDSQSQTTNFPLITPNRGRNVSRVRARVFEQARVIFQSDGGGGSGQSDPFLICSFRVILQKHRHRRGGINDIIVTLRQVIGSRCAVFASAGETTVDP